MADGEFEVIVYYTCAEENIGGTFELRFQNTTLTGKIREAHDPPLLRVNAYRYPNAESYTKAFKPLNLGKIALEKGKGTLSLNALNIPNKELMDFRLMLFKKV